MSFEVFILRLSRSLFFWMLLGNAPGADMTRLKSCCAGV